MLALFICNSSATYLLYSLLDELIEAFWQFSVPPTIKDDDERQCSVYKQIHRWHSSRADLLVAVFMSRTNKKTRRKEKRKKKTIQKSRRRSSSSSRRRRLTTEMKLLSCDTLWVCMRVSIAYWGVAKRRQTTTFRFVCSKEVPTTFYTRQLQASAIKGHPCPPLSTRPTKAIAARVEVVAGWCRCCCCWSCFLLSFLLVIEASQLLSFTPKERSVHPSHLKSKQQHCIWKSSTARLIELEEEPASAANLGILGADN